MSERMRYPWEAVRGGKPAEAPAVTPEPEFSPVADDVEVYLEDDDDED